MGTGATSDAVRVRDNANPDRFLIVNADGSVNVSPASGSVFTTKPPVAATVSTGAVTSVGTNEVTLLASNSSRKGALIQNLDTTVLAIYFTQGQTFAQAPLRLAQYQTWDAGQEACLYTGPVYGRRAATTGDAGVVEE